MWGPRTPAAPSCRFSDVETASMRYRDMRLAPMMVMAVASSAGPADARVSREDAIARQEVSFQTDRVDAVESTSDEWTVWRVMLTGRLPGQPQGPFETMIVEVYSTSGEVVSLART